MKEEEFTKRITSFIEYIRNSEIYLEYKKINDSIFDDKEIVLLNKKKDELISKYNQLKDSDEEHKLFKELNNIQNEINSKPIVKEYYRLRNEIKNDLQPIVDNILQKII